MSVKKKKKKKESELRIDKHPASVSTGQLSQSSTYFLFTAVPQSAAQLGQAVILENSGGNISQQARTSEGELRFTGLRCDSSTVEKQRPAPICLLLRTDCLRTEAE